MEAMPSDLNVEYAGSLAELYKKTAIVQAQLRALHGMVLQQIQVLDELIQFFELAVALDKKQEAAVRKFPNEWVFINGVSQCKEQISPTLASLRETARGRETLAEALQRLSESFKALVAEVRYLHHFPDTCLNKD